MLIFPEEGEGQGTLGEPAVKWGQGDEPKYASEGEGNQGRKETNQKAGNEKSTEMGE